MGLYDEKYPENAKMQQQYTGDTRPLCLPGNDFVGGCADATTNKEMSVIDKMADIYQQVNNLHRQFEMLQNNLNKVMEILGVKWR